MSQTSWHLKKVLSSVHQKSQAATGLCAIAKLTVIAELIYHIKDSFWWQWSNDIQMLISHCILSWENLKAYSELDLLYIHVQNRHMMNRDVQSPFQI